LNFNNFRRLPVILVHGITASAAGMEPTRKYFKVLLTLYFINNV